MSDFDFDAADEWRERQKWLPAWLDNTDPKTWFWHAALTLAGAWSLAWLTAHIPPIPFVWAGRLFYALYAWREYRNVRELMRDGRPLKPLDHTMDVASPIAAVELLAWWLA